MKSNFFEMLLSLVEKTLMQLKENLPAEKPMESSSPTTKEVIAKLSAAPTLPGSVRRLLFKSPSKASTRVFIPEEQSKLTLASYQYLLRMVSQGLITQDHLEIVMTILMLSESTYVTLEETKWAIRQSLADLLDPLQLAFLDLVLFQKEDNSKVH